MGNLGLDVTITELDTRIPKDVTDEKLSQQHDHYNAIFTACLNVVRCVGITVWGVSDKNSWVDSWFPNYGFPLLLDDNFNQKPAYDGADVALSSHVNPRSSSSEPYQPYE
ncbi:glycoside hydrolase superfamily [Trichophaea hybrida]|nr:glycoside hydrolase superfamily [Trichophaea hybrida]